MLVGQLLAVAKKYVEIFHFPGSIHVDSDGDTGWDRDKRPSRPHLAVVCNHGKVAAQPRRQVDRWRRATGGQARVCEPVRTHPRIHERSSPLQPFQPSCGLRR